MSMFEATIKVFFKSITCKSRMDPYIKYTDFRTQLTITMVVGAFNLKQILLK